MKVLAEQMEAGLKDAKCEEAGVGFEQAKKLSGSSWTTARTWLKTKNTTVRSA